ncbi:MAG: hypothetical protein L3J89_09630 [Gammaproteobacteria bacterium]|nr:hypothetical protein [Gammaproteobacteria bacterium]
MSAQLAGDVRDPQQASDFIKQLNLTDAQLENVLKSLGLATASAALAQAIISDQVLVARTPLSLLKTPSPDAGQATDHAPVEAITARPASLGPHEVGEAAAVVNENREEEVPPLCQRNSLTVSCEHGPLWHRCS